MSEESSGASGPSEGGGDTGAVAGDRRGLRTGLRAALVVLATGCLTGAGCFETTPLRPTEEVAWASVAAGGFHSCGLTEDGAAYCWGMNGRGQLGAGPGSLRGIIGRPNPVADGIRLRSLVAGRSHTCGLADSGRLYCWGQGESGQLGVDPASASGACTGTLCISPVSVPASDSVRFTGVAAGATHTCGITEAGAIYCWGDNSFGQLGTGVSAEGSGRPEAARIDSERDFTSVSAGEFHTCALAESGDVWCWGSNGGGQAGALSGNTCGASTDSAGDEVGGLPCTPAPARIDADARFTAVAAGGGHTCALDSSGAPWCWGSDARHALGNGHGSPEECLSSEDTPGIPCSRRPVRAATDAALESLSAGSDHVCGRTSSGTAWCWGNNSLGQVGYCGVGQPLEPAEVCSVSDFRGVAAGGLHSCGVTASGSAWCWGANGEGQLGSGSTRFSYFGPVQVGDALTGG